MYNAQGLQGQQMLQGMQAQMGSLGGFNLLGGTSTFFYMGNVIGLESKIEDTLRQPNQLTDISITVTGNQIKQFNMGCLLATTILGSIFIIPIFFLCCQWWKKIVYPAHQVPMSAYQKLQALISSSPIRSITLTVVDSTFDKAKAQFLFNILSRSAVKGFTFNNLASPNDCNSNEWSDFKDHMKPLKSLPMMTDLKWNTQVVL